MWLSLDVDKMRRGHDYFLARQERVIGASLAQAGDEALEHVQRYPEFKPRTGALQKATKAQAVRTRSGRVLRLTNSKDYAAAIDLGASPHTITARRVPYLHFRGSRGWARARSVNHPGNRPYRFLYNAHDAANRLFRADLTRRLGELGDSF